MSLAHMMTELYQLRMAEALHQAEQARLVRLARPETATRRPRWMALQQHLSTRAFWRKAALLKRTGPLTTVGCLSPVRPGAQCCGCAC
jgi:hypothetical protein